MNTLNTDTMKEFTIPTDIESEAVDFISSVYNTLKENQIIGEVDYAALDILARTYSLYIKASRQVEKEGITISTESGSLKPHPAIRIVSDTQTKVLGLMKEFGLTAKSRAAIPNMEVNQTPLESFISKKK